MAVTGENGNAGRLLSKEDKERVRQAIEGASSVEEVSLVPFCGSCRKSAGLTRESSVLDTSFD